VGVCDNESNKPTCKGKINPQTTLPESISTKLSSRNTNPSCLCVVWTKKCCTRALARAEKEVRIGRPGYACCRREGGQCGFKPSANIHGYDWLPSSSGPASDRVRFCPRRPGGWVQEELVQRLPGSTSLPAVMGGGEGASK
jgi:hypothetical protein